ncbi:MAG: hypothetical protein PHN75_17625 [Syntrophales bacterium]|nr:hypothetical protein [Syntrophales bacterium]
MNGHELKMAFSGKKTNLEGTYRKLTPPDLSGKILITEIAADGCLFSAALSHHLKPNDQIGIYFSLDDVRNSMIRKKAVVRKVDGRCIDCRFIIPHGTYDPDLGFYLRNP